MTETFGCSNAPSVNEKTSALVLDGRAAKKTSHLTWLFETARKYSGSDAFRKPGGRVVVVRSGQILSSPETQNPEAAAVSEAMVGFAKSLAKENGSRGATVNLLCDATPPTKSTSSANIEAPLEWLLSNQSAYVTGQELVVQNSPQPRNHNAGTILITGAAGAIGESTAEYFCATQDEGTTPRKLLLLDHPSIESKLSRLAESLALKTPSTVIDTISLDLSDAENAAKLLAGEASQRKGFSRIIHAAGITRDKTLRNMDLETSWLPVMKINLEATMAIDRALVSTPGALFSPRNDGVSSSNTPMGYSSFIYISSVSGICGNAGQSNYAATKAALLAYAKSMAYEFPDHGFRVVSPGFIQTDMTAKMPVLVRTIASKLNVLGQAGQPEDIAAAIAFLSSPEAACLAPGSNLRVCGLFMGGR